MINNILCLSAHNPDIRVLTYILNNWEKIKKINSKLNDFDSEYIKLLLQNLSKYYIPQKYILKRIKILSEIIPFKYDDFIHLTRPSFFTQLTITKFYKSEKYTIDSLYQNLND